MMRTFHKAVAALNPDNDWAEVFLTCWHMLWAVMTLLILALGLTP